MRQAFQISHGRVEEQLVSSVSSSAKFALVLLILLVTLGPLTNSALEIAGFGSQGDEGNAFRQATYGFSFLLTIFVTGAYIHPRSLLEIPATLIVTIIWFGVTLIWAVDQGIGTRRWLLTTIILVNTFLIVRHCGYEITLKMVRWIAALVLIANYLAVAIVPDWAIHQYDAGDENLGGTWRGVLMHKNNAGAMCAFTILFFGIDARRVPFLLKIAIMCAAMFFLFKTGSKTSLVVVGISYVSGLLYLAYNRYYKNLIYLLLGLLVAITLTSGLYFASELIDAFNNPQTLTGRVQIWHPLVQYWKQNWLTGSGFGSFWDIGTLRLVAQYLPVGSEWVADVVSGHNGYLDILVQTGIIGLILAVLSTVVKPLVGLIEGQVSSSAHGGLFLSTLIFVTIHNLTESDLFQRDATVHSYLMIILALLSIENVAPANAAQG
ncbi:O-antigen ligase [Burkholderiales bacterium 8X]|nr:O-antigen ligase [Burkholderiales bacterium 8X]